ncbi:PREDICTED: uncharacterized protein LOC104709840 [Camelina sativa]|uniref:Uncharacterized protein LOC104709840 n=1 Tax=Camelina sativa TaxID=90675 RepID=A0ABM1QD35_CAMSA|nr:PREDICTED: uncharacterized protein LOC104709840 [Camelina sativa]
MKQHGYTGKLPTVADLTSLIDSKFLSKINGLPRSEDAATLFRDHYNCEFIVHRRPKLTLVQENEEFEKFIERRLAIGQVAMCFSYVSGYSGFCSVLNDRRRKNTAFSVFRLNEGDIQQMFYEKLDEHCAVITGHGVMIKGCESIEYFEIQETQGPCFADNDSLDWNATRASLQKL